MKRVLTLVLVLALSLSLCACGSLELNDRHGDDDDREQHNSESTEGNLPKVDAEFLSLVCGKWWRYSGWSGCGPYPEFCEDGTCIINDEELTWDAAFKTVQWLDAPKEFVSVYRNDTLVYEAYISALEDGTATLVISGPDPSGMGIVPAGTYVQMPEDESDG